MQRTGKATLLLAAVLAFTGVFGITNFANAEVNNNDLSDIIKPLQPSQAFQKKTIQAKLTNTNLQTLMPSLDKIGTGYWEQRKNDWVYRMKTNNFNSLEPGNLILVFSNSKKNPNQILLKAAVYNGQKLSKNEIEQFLTITSNTDSVISQIFQTKQQTQPCAISDSDKKSDEYLYDSLSEVIY